jgi:acyl-[acyl-carrier-protein] desaturase
MRLHGLSALLVAFGWIDECSGFGQSLRWPAFRSPVARATAARMLDIVVEGDKPAAAPIKEEVPEYMKSKRRLYPRKCDVMDEIEYFVQEKIDDGLLLNVEKAWQPSDFLPDSQRPTEEWFDEVREIREAHAEVPDEILLVLIGDMVTEEALPTYLTLLNTLEGTDDPTGAVDTAWGRWSRQWTAEENRHGDLLNRYLYLGGRCDMKSIEKTIMRLISSGFDPDTRSDPYRGFIYTSFQERATKISHGNVGKLLAGAGDQFGAKICARIAGDEARHEKAYQLFVERVLELDPDGAIISYADMMKKQIVMPAELMCDGYENPQRMETGLYEDFGRVATDLQVYTGVDYADIIEHLNEFWQIEKVTGLGPEAQEAQEYLGKLPVRFRKLANRQQKQLQKTPREVRPWPWINGREC